MQRLWIGLVAVAFAILSSASHAQVLNWTGPYVGAFGGYGWGTQGQHDNGVPIGCIGISNINCPTEDGHYNVSGALGGAVIGYSFPLSQIVGFNPFNQLIIGAEGDIAGADLSGSGTCNAVVPHRCGGDIFMMSDIRLRLGIPFGQFMPFFAGGLAVDDVHAYDNLLGVSGTRLQAGWTIGGGLEYKITAQLSARIEYLFQELPRTAMFDVVPGVPEGIRTDVNVVRAGLVWNFSPPPPPAPPIVTKY